MPKTYYTIIPLAREHYYRIAYVRDDGGYGTEPMRPIIGLPSAKRLAREMAIGDDEIVIRRGAGDYVKVTR